MINKRIMYIIGFILIGTIIGIYASYKLETFLKKQTAFKGICLFDIDNTLTTGTENERVVDICLNAGYAVGISTANPSYNPHTIMFFKWMPKNLYNFMIEHDFDTFNNVSSLYLNGKINKTAYQKIESNLPENVNIYGWRKGFTLLETAKIYNIEDTSKMLLFDDDRGYIDGIKAFTGNRVKVICSGDDCGGILNESTVLNAI